MRRAHRPPRRDRHDRRGGLRRPASARRRRAARRGHRPRARRNAATPSARRRCSTGSRSAPPPDGAERGRGRYWTLDPIDGTKGFLRGDQYAIALALIDDGEVVLGVLGCPNLPNPDGSTGAILAAVAGGAGARLVRRRRPTRGRCASPRRRRLAEARFCESVESGHSNQDHSAQIAARLGITAEPYRIDSQCKYAAVARGDASIYLRLPTRADYREKIWDHAAGKFVVERAGGVVTDVTGAPLDFAPRRHARGQPRHRRHRRPLPRPGDRRRPGRPRLTRSDR